MTASSVHCYTGFGLKRVSHPGHIESGWNIFSKRTSRNERHILIAMEALMSQAVRASNYKASRTSPITVAAGNMSEIFNPLCGLGSSTNKLA